MTTCGWFIKKINVIGMTVNFYIGISGNSWGIVLKDSKGNIEAQKSGSSYGDHSLTATTTGAHTLELTCNWNTSNPCEVCSVNIPGSTVVINSIHVTLSPENYTNKGSDGWYVIAIDATGTGVIIVKLRNIEIYRINASGDAVYQHEVQLKTQGEYTICAEVV